MLVQPLNRTYNQTFGLKFKLSEETKKTIEKSTGLSQAEMSLLPLKDALKLMKERETSKEASKIKLWLSEKYRQFGKKLVC